jgi:hypothetical protein
VIVPGVDGFDWSSAGIAVAAFAGLLVVSIGVMSAIRGGRDHDSTGGSDEPSGDQGYVARSAHRPRQANGKGSSPRTTE